MNDVVLSEQFVPFYPCTSMRQVEIAEWFIFGMLPGLKTFTREVTPAERADGIIYSHALVEKTADGISRKYGAMLVYRGEMQ
jgi:hypothetical protein